MAIVSRFFAISKYFFIVAILLLMTIEESYTQSWVAESQQAGFILKKVVSDTTVATGQPFSYTIYFTIPAGASNVTITDQLPASLKFLGSSVTSACGSPVVTAPAINSTNGTFSINWSSLPGGCTGSFTMTVAFPNGVTCPGTTARNNVCLNGTLDGKFYEFCTPYVTTTAVAVNPWGIYKYPIGVAWQGGNCQYLTASDTITWQVCVYKSVGTTGQLNLVNGLVTDTLPTGAVLTGSTCGAVQTGNIITWNVGNMNADQMYNTVCCQFTVYYPQSIFPDGSQISNQATLSGSLGSANQPCSNFSIQSNKPCVEKKNITNASVSKWVYTNRQPGCDGQYLIYICNTGTTTITVSGLDTLPTQLSNFAVSSAWNLSATITGGIVSITGTLSPGQCGYIYISFTIPQSIVVGSTVTNCVTVNITGLSPTVACSSFIVDTPAPKPCLWKEVCNKQVDYTPGSTFRYRLRIQNIGGLPITGSTLTDVLDPNLEYVGNPSFYISNSWNTPCTSTPANPWTGVNLSYNAGTNTITALLDTIPATCQNLFYASCGMYGTGGVPYYFIEVDVKVRDTSALGNVPNHFSITGGSLGSTISTSNIENVLVTGVVGYNLEKGVKKPTDTNYGTSISTTAGSTVNYKLKMNSSGTAALRHVTFADLLPMDNATADSKILFGCGSRGSQFSVPFSSLGTTSPAVFSYWNNPATTLANVNLWTPTGAPGNSFTIGCGTTGSWTSSAWVANQKNLGAYFGPNAIGVSGASIEFSGIVAATAKPLETACNSFVTSGWTKHLIQSSLPSFQLAGQLESPTACITIDTVPVAKPCIELKKFDVQCKGLDQNGNQQYAFSISATSCFPATLLISSPDGTFAPASFAITSSSWNINSTFTYTSTNNPIKIEYSLICNNNEVCRDSIFRDLPPCDNHPSTDECCVKFIHTIGKPTFQTNNSTGFVGLSVPIVAGPVPIKKFTATIVSAQLRKVCGSSPSAWTRIFGDITIGNLVVAPAAGPQLLDIFSREATWGPGACIDWNKGAQLNLKMIYPAFSGGFKCRDTLMFKIRYTFTDCECRTCDTLVDYTIVRRWQFLPWDVDLGGIGIGHIRGAVKSGEDFQADEPTATSLVMNDANNGKLWVISPDKPENNVTITGVELRSLEVPLTGLSTDKNQGYIQGDVAYIAMNVDRGQSSVIDIKFQNTGNKMKFPVVARFAYRMTDSEEIFYSDAIEYMALVPGADPDEMGIDMATRPENVRTYALYFNNSNGYKQSISAIGLKPTGNMKLLAVGPPDTESNETYLIPQLLENGTYSITSPQVSVAGVDSKSVVKPIFITLSGVDDLNAVIDFSTYDSNAGFISSGSIMLNNPISKVEFDNSGFGSDITIQSIVPNPVNDIVTVTISAKSNIQDAKISILDMLGREVVSITDSNATIGQGTHIHTVDVSKLTSGMYYFTIQSNGATVSKAISIVR